MKAIIRIIPREEVPDATGLAIQSRLSDQGTSDISRVRVGKLVILEFEGGDVPTITNRVEKLTQELLVNDLLEEYSFTIED